MFTYIAPLAFVLAITMIKEFLDDFKRFRRDKEINEKQYTKIVLDGSESPINSEDIKVGDIIKIKQNERIPADLILIYTTHEETQNIFI